jgi:hypothetical protein
MPNENRTEERHDPLPESFETLDAAGAFWDAHSSVDYENEMEDVDVEVDLSTSKVYFAIERDLVREVREQARRKGVSTEELIRRWLKEKVAAA